MPRSKIQLELITVYKSGTKSSTIIKGSFEMIITCTILYLMSNMTDPIRNLWKLYVEFTYLVIHEEALDKLQSVIMETPVLSNFDEGKPTMLQYDSSKFGCIQNNQPATVYIFLQILKIITIYSINVKHLRSYK